MLSLILTLVRFLFQVFFFYSVVGIVCVRVGVCVCVCVCVAVNSHACYIWIVNDIADCNTSFLDVTLFLNSILE